MIKIVLNNCMADAPLSEQLAKQIDGFSWRRDQYGPLVTEITKVMMDYRFLGSRPVDPTRCGFCAKDGITTEYMFEAPDLDNLDTITMPFGNEVYEITLPRILTTGSKCKEFPRLADFVRENLNNVFRGIRYDSPSKDGLLCLSGATLHPRFNQEEYRYKMLHIPLNYISVWERYPLMEKLCKEYDFFIFAKRKKLPPGTNPICSHADMKALCKWYPRDAYRGQGKDIVIGIPFSEIIKFGGIL